MTPSAREQRFRELFPEEPAYRLKQAREALFDARLSGWDGATALPSAMRETLAREVPWTFLSEKLVLESAKKDTFKALLSAADGKEIETVLMRNQRGWWTICVSSQVGCAMKCAFCATGKMGLSRNLSSDEIVDQYRHWDRFLAARPELPRRITNIVFMGMGEPLANYANVRAALRDVLEMTDIGPTRITVSTVGVLPRLESLLEDPLWPHVRLAVSLHSAVALTRKDIIPTSFDGFLPALADWARRYLAKFGNRRHHLTFEYVMLGGVNDTLAHADALAAFVNGIGEVRVNLIPYNFTGSEFRTSERESLEAFKARLEKRAVTVTTRRTMGDDIAAACGQLKAEAVQ